ncbi:MAG: cytochrome P450 [Acidimicrobiales bacterium]
MIEPTPPSSSTPMPWDAPVTDPVAALANARADLGDTFAVTAPDTTYLFLFSPIGVQNFYALGEDEASKAMADWRMLRRKLPDELFLGRRTLPHQFFGRSEVVDYLAVLEAVVQRMTAALGPAGTFDVFSFTRTVGHQLGLGSWAGPETLDHPEFESLIAALDRLDGSAAFVDPGAMGAVAADHQQVEREAMATVERILGDTVRRRLVSPPVDDLLQQIIERWTDEPENVVVEGVARDVIVLHLGSMSNLFAALAWTIVDLLRHEPARDQVLAADDPSWVERCALESTRLAQRSIMLREVLQMVQIDDGTTEWTVTPGATIATLLPLTNRSAGPGLDRYDPDRWVGRRLADPPDLAARELVTVFGHGSHICPARPFSLAAMALVITELFTTFELQPQYESVGPRPGQIGGVARADRPTPVRYRRRG